LPRHHPSDPMLRIYRDGIIKSVWTIDPIPLFVDEILYCGRNGSANHRDIGVGYNRASITIDMPLLRKEKYLRDEQGRGPWALIGNKCQRRKGLRVIKGELHWHVSIVSHIAVKARKINDLVNSLIRFRFYAEAAKTNGRESPTKKPPRECRSTTVGASAGRALQVAERLKGVVAQCSHHATATMATRISGPPLTSAPSCCA
jgi:hypothetical protein